MALLSSIYVYMTHNTNNNNNKTWQMTSQIAKLVCNLVVYLLWSVLSTNQIKWNQNQQQIIVSIFYYYFHHPFISNYTLYFTWLMLCNNFPLANKNRFCPAPTTSANYVLYVLQKKTTLKVLCTKRAIKQKAF